MDKIRIDQQARDVQGDVIAGNKSVTIVSNETLKSSNLSNLIQELARIAPFKKASEKLDTRKFNIYDIDDKITQNSVKKYRVLINEYSSYYEMCDNTLNAIDELNPSAKDTLLRYVHNTYILERDSILSGNLTTFWEEIQRNADRLIDDVVNVFYNDLSETNIYKSCTVEEAKNQLLCFVVYCFICCKILEEPQK